MLHVTGHLQEWALAANPAPEKAGEPPETEARAAVRARRIVEHVNVLFAHRVNQKPWLSLRQLTVSWNCAGTGCGNPSPFEAS